MSASTRAMVWEEWRQTRHVLALLALVVLADIPTGIYMGKWEWPARFLFIAPTNNGAYQNDFRTMGDAYTVFAIVTAALFMLMYFDRRLEIHFGLPKRLFRAPVTMATLVRVTWGFRVILGSAVISAILLMHSMMLWFDTTLSPRLIPAFLAMFVLLFPVAAYASAYTAGKQTVTVFGAAMVIAATYPVLFWLSLNVPYLLLPAALLLSYAGYRHGISMRRCGSSLAVNFRVPNRHFSSLSQFPVDVSPLAAQTRLEWRRFGLIMPAVAIVVALIIAAGLMFEKRVSLGRLSFLEFLIAGAAGPTVLGAFVASLVIAYSDYRRRNSGVNRFVATRPVNARTLAKARQLMALRSILVTWGMLFVFCVWGYILLRYLSTASYLRNPNEVIPSWDTFGVTSWGAALPWERSGALWVTTHVLVLVMWFILMWAAFFVATFEVAVAVPLFGAVLIAINQENLGEINLQLFMTYVLVFAASSIVAAVKGLVKPAAVWLTALGCCLSLLVEMMRPVEVFFAFFTALFVVYVPWVAALSFVSVPLRFHRTRSWQINPPAVVEASLVRQLHRRWLVRIAVVAGLILALYLPYRAQVAWSARSWEGRAWSHGTLLTQERWEKYLGENQAPHLAPADALDLMIQLRPGYLNPSEQSRGERNGAGISPDEALNQIEAAMALGPREFEVSMSNASRWVCDVPQKLRNEMTALASLIEWCGEGAVDSARAGDSAMTFRYLRSAFFLAHGGDMHPSMAALMTRASWSRTNLQKTQEALSLVRLEPEMLRELRSNLPDYEWRETYDAVLSAYATEAYPFLALITPWDYYYISWVRFDCDLLDPKYYEHQYYDSKRDLLLAWNNVSGVLDTDRVAFLGYFFNERNWRINRTSKYDFTKLRRSVDQRSGQYQRHFWLFPNTPDLLAFEGLSGNGARWSELYKIVLRAGLATLEFEARNGKLPDTLWSLVPDLLPHPPIDPLIDPSKIMDDVFVVEEENAKANHHALRYRLDGAASFIVYSTGLNGLDDFPEPDGAENVEDDIGFKISRN